MNPKIEITYISVDNDTTYTVSFEEIAECIGFEYSIPSNVLSLSDRFLIEQIKIDDVVVFEKK